MRKKQARRRKRLKEKKEQAKAKGKKGASQREESDGEDNEMEIEKEGMEVQLVDLFTPYLVVRGGGKIRSFDFGADDSGAKGVTQLFLALSTNALEVHGIPQVTKFKDAPPDTVRLFSIDFPGHRADVRTLCLSSDDTLLASASNGTSFFSYSILPSRSIFDLHLRVAQGVEHENDGLHTNSGMRACHL